MRCFLQTIVYAHVYCTETWKIDLIHTFSIHISWANHMYTLLALHWQYLHCILLWPCWNAFRQFKGLLIKCWHFKGLLIKCYDAFPLFHNIHCIMNFIYWSYDLVLQTNLSHHMDIEILWYIALHLPYRPGNGMYRGQSTSLHGHWCKVPAQVISVDYMYSETFIIKT